MKVRRMDGWTETGLNGLLEMLQTTPPKNYGLWNSTHSFAVY